MTRFTFIAITLLLATAATASPQEMKPQAPPTFSILHGQPFLDWNNAEVVNAQTRLVTYMRPRQGFAPKDMNAPDAIDALANDKSTPTGLYSVVKDARNQFKNDAVPGVQQLGQELPSKLTASLSSHLRRQGSISLPGSSAVAMTNAESSAALAEIIKQLVNKMVNGSLQDMIAGLFGVDLAVRIGKLISPIAISALNMLVEDLSHAVKHIAGSIMKRVERSVWLKELRDLVVKDLRENTLAMLATVKTTLVENLGGVIIATIVYALHINGPVAALIKSLFGEVIDTAIAQVVTSQINRLSAHLRNIWNIPEVSQLVNSIMTKTTSLKEIAAPAA
ncbi:hypothetical protein BDF19DRAFT_429960 [Syncephalis fuscata]|nr:hypothetical protein BDF19DRAFT_429960 [Syncephalis fuscata]